MCYRVYKTKYTFKHRRAFRAIERKLLGKNTIRSLFHDVDKYVLYWIFGKRASRIHRRWSRHHDRARTKLDHVQMVIDWECARFTKSDKPLNARETLYEYYPELKSDINPILDDLNL